MVGAVAEVGYLQAALELLHAFLVFLVFEEKEGVGKVNDPEVGVVCWKS